MSTGAYTKLFSLKSHDYMLDRREDELLWELHEKAEFTIATNTADLEVATSLDEIVGFVPLWNMSLWDTGYYIDAFGTDGVISSGKVTVRIVTAGVGGVAFSTSFFLVGRRTRVDV
jgi:hypothetical protein